MSDWHDYLDLQASEQFDAWTLTTNITPVLTSENGGLLLAGITPYIYTNIQCACQFLTLVENGLIDFGCQQRVVKLLFSLHQAVHARESKLAPLAGLLSHTLQVLSSRIDEFMLHHNHALEIDSDVIGEAYGFGGDAGAIRYGLSVARTVALCTFIRAFCDKFAHTARPADLCGEWHLLVTDPTDTKYAKSYPGHYGMCAEATINKYPRRDVWQVKFLHFPPLAPWYSLEGAAYQAATPVLTKVLEATVTAVGNLSD